MHKRKKKTVLFALVFFTIALLGYGQLWAQDCNSATPRGSESNCGTTSSNDTGCRIPYGYRTAATPT